MKDRVQPDPNSRANYFDGVSHPVLCLEAPDSKRLLYRGSGGSMLRMAMSVSSARVCRLRFALAILLGMLVSLGARCAFSQNAGPDDGPLQPSTDITKPHFIDNDSIVKMSKAGLDDKIIIQTIQTQPGHYETNPDNLIALKNAFCHSDE